MEQHISLANRVKGERLESLLFSVYTLELFKVIRECLRIKGMTNYYSKENVYATLGIKEYVSFLWSKTWFTSPFQRWARSKATLLGKGRLRPSLTHGSSQGHFKKKDCVRYLGTGRFRMGSSEKTFNKGEILNVLVHKLEVPRHILQKRSSQFTHGQRGRF